MVIDGVSDELNGMERHYFFEEGERRVPCVGMREGGDGGSARPGDNGSQEDTDQDRALDTIHHEKDCQEADRAI